MRNIKDIDISKRCGLKPTNTIFDFIEKITSEVFQEKMKNIISWKNDKNINLQKTGVEAEEKYTPYLNSKLKDIPEEILNSYSRNWCIDDENNFYIYKPCCM